MDRACPYCASVELETDEAGVLRCRDCGRSCLPDASQSAAAIGALRDPDPVHRLDASPGAPRPRARRESRGAPAEIPSWPAALLAVAVTAAFYGLLYLLPPTPVGALFTERGWVPYIITLISTWALLLLAMKLVRLRRERAVLSRQLIALPPDGRLRPDEAGVALAALRAEPPEISQSFLGRRVERALHHFQARRNAVEVVEFLASEARADEGRVDASYALVRVFVWAVPTLGFIGTVLGIGAAVAGFSATLEAASSLDAMKESIGVVTGGLGVAFDTTLLALVMSILIMFPASAVQRVEEGFLGEVDDYCAEHLVPRLRDAPEPRADDDVVAALARRLVAAMRTSGDHEG
jgi:biopolymer transport protein ExbB/TolQ